MSVIIHAFHICFIVVDNFSTFIHIGDPGILIIQLLQIIRPGTFHTSGNIHGFFFQLIHQLSLKIVIQDPNDKCQSQYCDQ